MSKYTFSVTDENGCFIGIGTADDEMTAVLGAQLLADMHDCTNFTQEIYKYLYDSNMVLRDIIRVY